MLEEGTKAPQFCLPDKDGNVLKLENFKGKKVVLYFYPKDNTPGCSRQAEAFSGIFEKYESMGVVLIGISKDSQDSHRKFACKYNLPFILLSDTELKTIKDYDVWKEKKLYGKVSMGVVRTTYLISEDGIIEKVWTKVKPADNPAEVLDYLQNSL